VVPHVAKVYASNWRTPVLAAKSGNGFNVPHVLTGASRLIRPTCVPVIAVKPVPASGASRSSFDAIEMVFDPVWTWNGMVVGLGPPKYDAVNVKFTICGHGASLATVNRSGATLAFGPLCAG